MRDILYFSTCEIKVRIKYSYLNNTRYMEGCFEVN